MTTYHMKYDGGRTYSVWRSTDNFYTGRCVFRGPYWLACVVKWWLER